MIIPAAVNFLQDQILLHSHVVCFWKGTEGQCLLELLCHIRFAHQGLGTAESQSWQPAPCCLSEMWPKWGHRLPRRRPRYIQTNKSHKRHQSKLAVRCVHLYFNFHPTACPSCIVQNSTGSGGGWSSCREHLACLHSRLVKMMRVLLVGHDA